MVLAMRKDSLFRRCYCRVEVVFYAGILFAKEEIVGEEGLLLLGGREDEDRENQRGERRQTEGVMFLIQTRS